MFEKISNNCLSCDNLNNRKLIDNKCKCEDGYLDINNQQIC